MAITGTQIPPLQLSPADGQQQTRVKIPTLRIEPSRGRASLKLGELWEYRELLYFLVWRDIKVRYKQTAIGAAWAVVQPLMTMIVFTVLFGNFAKMPSEGLPYPIFTYTALLPWNLFTNALSRSSGSLVSEAHLITKVYFPRLIVPLAATVSGVIDFAIAFVVLLAMMVWFGIAPTWGVIVLPIFFTSRSQYGARRRALASGLNVRYRDVGYTIPFLMQIWMFASPVFYPVSLVPEKWHLLYSLNPMAGVIEGFRWALLGKQTPAFGVMALSTIVVAVLLRGGFAYFKRTERTFADIV